MYFLILDSAINYTSSSCIIVNNSPNWEFVPVSMTMPLPRPHLTSVPMKATQVIPETPVLCSFSGRGLMFLPFGMGSPVKLDSSTAKSLACMGRKTFKKRLLVYYYQVFHKSVIDKTCLKQADVCRDFVPHGQKHYVSRNKVASKECLQLPVS